MSETKLLPCPFCGGEAELDCDNIFGNWFVRCTKCFCKTPKHATEFFAKVCWNTRKPVERILERLKEVAFPDFEEEYTCNGSELLFLSDAIEIIKEDAMNRRKL